MMPDDIKWAKFLTSMRRNKKMLLIRAMPEGDALYCIWVDLILIAAEVNNRGYIYIEPGVLYDDESLGTILDRHPNIIRLAIDTFLKLKMIELDDNGILLTGFADIQDIEGMERTRELNRLRNQKYRRNLREKREQVKIPEHTQRDVSVTSRDGIDKNRIEYIRERLDNLLKDNVNINNYNAYYKNLRIIDIENNEIIIAADTEETALHLESNGMQLIKRLLFSLNCDVEPRIVLLEK